MTRLISIFVFILVSFQIIYSQSGWVRQYTGINGALGPLCFVNENTGYLNGVPNIKTVNGGLNWSIIDTTVLIGGRSVFFINSNTGFIGLYNRIYKTMDGGLTWIYFTVANSLINCIYFKNEFTGWAAMGFQFNGNIYKTSNAGASWYNTLTSPGIGSVHFANINIGYALGTYGEVYKSTNGGDNWINYHPGSGGSTCIQATDTNIIYVSYSNGRIRKSTDGGTNWIVQQTSTSTSFRSLFFINSNTGWAVGGYGNPGQAIVGTTNGGADWNIQISGNSPRLWFVYFINSNTGWAVGDSGLVLKTTTGGYTGIEPKGNLITNTYSLSQNYPNPFNPNSKIKFQIPKDGAKLSKTKLVVYDVLGREVQTIVDEELTPGTYEVDFDGTNLPSGVYYYQLTAGDPSLRSGQAFIVTKKMVLLR